MSSGGDFKAEDWVFLTIGLRFASFLSLYGRRNNKLRTIGVIDEEHWAVVGWVNILFHCSEQYQIWFYITISRPKSLTFNINTVLSKPGETPMPRFPRSLLFVMCV